MKYCLKIDGMTCNHCVNHVKNAIEEINGTKGVEVSLENGSCVFESQNLISEKELREIIEDLGYNLISVTEA